MFHFHREKARDGAIAALSGKLCTLPELPVGGGAEPVWKSYWFAIEGRELNWYETDRMISKIGSFELVTLHKIERNREIPHSAFLFNAHEDLAIRGRSEHELEMWLRAIELYADLSRGGDGTGIVNVPEPIDSFRKRVHDEETEYLDQIVVGNVSSAHSAEGKAAGTYVVDRQDAKEHGHTLVRHADEFDTEEKDQTQSERKNDKFSAKCRLISNPFTFEKDGASSKPEHYISYDDHHHLVTHHNVDTGVTTFDKDGTMHTNFYY